LIEGVRRVGPRARLARLFTALMLGGLMSGCAPTGPSSAPASPTPRPSHAGCVDHAAGNAVCIVIVGDSLGVGAPLTGAERWWIQLQGALESALPAKHVRIDNWAVSGSQLDLLEWFAQDRAGLSTYDLAIVIEGVNDARVSMPVEGWRPRYERALAAIGASGPSVVLMTPPPAFSGGQFGSSYDATIEAIRAVAGDRPLIDVAARWREDGPVRAAAYYVDEIHQSAAGQEVMAQLALPVVLAAVDSR
jgi:lysophospholipase L1-like esterase